MDWLQSSQLCHQVLGERTGNKQKGYKAGDGSRNFDPDKSDTPLLHDNPATPDTENSKDDWNNYKTEHFFSAEKKQYPLLNCSSSSSKILKGSIKNKGGSSQIKSLSSRSPHAGNDEKLSENEKLLIDFGNNVNNEGSCGAADDDDEEEWSLPHTGRYHKVHSDAE